MSDTVLLVTADALPLPGFEEAASARQPKTRKKTTRAAPTFKPLPPPCLAADAVGVPLESPAVDVVVDGAPERLGALSYTNPGISICVGDAVEVPFGKQSRYGVVIGPGDSDAATREVVRSFGLRTHPAEIVAAHRVAANHFVPTASVIRRLAPRKGKGADPLDAGPALLSEMASPRISISGAAESHRRYIARAPGVSAARLAAESALTALERFDKSNPDLKGLGQVLICCPTKDLVAATCAEFESGAARVDAGAGAEGAWSGFAAGTLRVAVGSRASAWFAPLHLAGIVVAEEHHVGHIEARQPHTHTRDVAVARLEGRDVSLTFTGLCPSSAALGASVKLCEAGTAADWPTITVVDRSDRSPGFRAVPTPVRLAVARALRAGVTPYFVADRKSARASCVKCNTTRNCAECGDPRCATPKGPCARCGAVDTKLVGWDPRRIEEMFDGQVQAGTWSDAADCSSPLTIIFDADTPSRIPHLEPEYRAANQILTAIDGAYGDRHVMLITDDPDSAVLRGIAAADARTLARQVWATAKELSLPPFGRTVHIKAQTKNAPKLGCAAGHVVGPRQVSGDEWEIFVRCSDAELPSVGRAVDRLRRSARIRVTVS